MKGMATVKLTYLAEGLRYVTNYSPPPSLSQTGNCQGWKKGRDGA